MPPRSPSPSPSRGSHGDGEYDTDLLAPEPSHPAPPSPAFTNSTIYRTPDDDYSDADTDITGRDGIATPVTVSVSGDNHSPPSGGGGRGLRYEDLPPSYEEAQWQSQSQPQQFHAYEQHQQHATLPANPLSPPPSFAESFHTPVGGGNANASDPVLPAVERLVIREKERAASEQGGSERSAFSGSGDGGSNGLSFAAVEGLASEHHGALEVALQWAHPAYHVGDQKEPLSGAALARPVAVPQVNVAEESAGGDGEEDEEAYGPANILSFSRAYAPALQQAHGVSLPIFVAFLDGLNAVCHAARAPATDAEASDVDLSLVETYLARANALFFAQRGLLVRVVDVDGLLDDVLRISTSRRSLRDALAGDVTRDGASERERVDALDPWVERLSWEGLPPATLRLWDLRGHQHQEQQQQQQQQAQEQQRTGNIGAPTTADFVPTATAAATTPAYASGEFYSNPPGVAGGYLDEKAQARAWADSSQPSQQQQHQDQAGPSSSHNPPAHPFPPFPPLGPFPGFGPPPPMNHFADGARWSDWGQGVGRRWADWGQQLGRGWAMWGQEVGSRAAQLGQDVGRGVVDETMRAGAGPWGSAGRGAFLGGARGHWGGGPGGGGHRGPQHQHQQQHQQQWGPWGPYGYGLGGRRGFGFAGRGRGPPGMGMGMGMGMGPGMGVGMGPGMGMGGHQLRGGWGPGGGWQQPGTFSGFGQGTHHHQHEAERSAEAMPTGSSQQDLHHHPGGPYESTTTLGSSHISLEDNDRDDDNDSDADDDDSDSDSDLDEIEVSFLKRMRSIENAAADALAKGKRAPGDVARERDKHIDKAKAERTKAERKLEARRKKDEGKREMKAKKKEWKESRQAYRTSAGKGKAEGKGKWKAEKKALRKEWKEARGKWREGRREERVERKGERKEKKVERRSGGGGGGGGCGARQAEQVQAQAQSQQRGVEVGVVAAGDEGVSSSSAPRSLPPQLLWVVVENLEN